MPSNAIPFPAGAFADRGRTLRLIVAGASERRIVAAHAAEQRKFIARERATLNNRISLDASGLSDTLSAAG